MHRGENADHHHGFPDKDVFSMSSVQSAERMRWYGPLRVFVIKFYLATKPYSDHLSKYMLGEVCLYIKNLCGLKLVYFICPF